MQLSMILSERVESREAALPPHADL
jgi:hypothetical protein